MTNDTLPDGQPIPTRTWFNTNDHYTYWLGTDGDLMAAPPLDLKDTDWENYMYVVDFDVPLPPSEKAFIIYKLSSPDNEPPAARDKCSVPRLVDEALTAFWLAINHRFPGANTGTLPENRTEILWDNAQRAIAEWIVNNVPENSSPR